MIHAIERARERYGLELTTDNLKAIVSKCSAGKGVLMARLDNGLERYLVQWNGTGLIVLLNVSKKMVVTVLPSSQLGVKTHQASPKNKTRRLRKIRNRFKGSPRVV